MMEDGNMWLKAQENRHHLIKLFSRQQADASQSDIDQLCDSFVSLLKDDHVREEESNLDLEKLISSFIFIAFPSKDDSNLIANNLSSHKEEASLAQLLCQQFLQKVLEQLYKEKIRLSTFLELAVTTPWIDTDTLKRFIQYCFNVLVTDHEKQNQDCRNILAVQEQWTSEKEPHLMSSIVELLLPFSHQELFSLLKDIISERSDLNWKFCLLFVAAFVICVEDDEAKNSFKDLLSLEISSSLESEDETQFVFILVFVRHICFDPQITSHPFASYKGWFEHYFGRESSSLANSKKKISALCKFLTNLVPFEISTCIRAHLNSPPFVPLQLRQSWTDYFNLARTRLCDLGAEGEVKTAPIFAPVLKQQVAASSQDKSELDCDIVEAISAFVKNGNKIPTKVMEASVFRRAYFESTFLPRLLELGVEVEGIEASDRHRFILELSAKGKIPRGLQGLLPKAKTASEHSKMRSSPLKRKHQSS